MPDKPNAPNSLAAFALIASLGASALLFVNYHLGAATGHALYVGGVLV